MNSLNDIERAVYAIEKNQESTAMAFAQGSLISSKLMMLAMIIGDPATIRSPTLDEVNARRGYE